MDFELATSDLGEGVVSVAVTGEVDLVAAPVLRQLFATVADSGTSRLIVDLSGATFIDSTTLGVLVGVNQRLRAHEGVMVIACNANIRTLFELTLLDRVFDIVDSRDAALSLLRTLADDVDRGAAEQ